jgi:hypothetical protein
MGNANRIVGDESRPVVAVVVVVQKLPELSVIQIDGAK